MPAAHDSVAQPPPLFPWRDALLCLAIFAVALTVFLRSPIIDVGDSKFTLLLTQNLLSKHGFMLDRYHLGQQGVVNVGNAVLDSHVYQIEFVDGHTYYYFPPGSSILSTPFVLVEDWLGHSVLDANRQYSLPQEVKLQHSIASFLMALLVVIFYGTARLLLPAGWSALIAVGTAFGTQIWSTASRGLWTHTWGISLLGTALYLLLAQETGRRKVHPVLLATVLSWTYFVRPTNAIFIIGITVYLVLYYRKSFVPYAATGAAWFVAFVAYSWEHFHHLLPSYYQANRLAATTFWEALTGNLISPSRGTLIYVPVLLFVFYLVARYWRHQTHRGLVWLALAVSAGHLAAVSGFVPWYGGWCYGPRYTTELVPWFVLLTVLGTRAALRRRADAATHRPAPSPGTRPWRRAVFYCC